MDFAELLGPGYQYARELLAEADAFPPFAIFLDTRGKLSVIVAEDGLQETVRDEISKLNRHTPCDVVAFFDEAAVQEHGRSIQRLIRVHVQARGGLNQIVLTPFLNNDGHLQIGVPSIRDAATPALPDFWGSGR